MLVKSREARGKRNAHVPDISHTPQYSLNFENGSREPLMRNYPSVPYFAVFVVASIILPSLSFSVLFLDFCFPFRSALLSFLRMRCLSVQVPSGALCESL